MRAVESRISVVQLRVRIYREKKKIGECFTSSRIRARLFSHDESEKREPPLSCTASLIGIVVRRRENGRDSFCLSYVCEEVISLAVSKS